jgi:hypothetical protein
MPAQLTSDPGEAQARATGGSAVRRRAVSLVAGRVAWGRAARSRPGGSSGGSVVVVAGWLEVVFVEVAGDRGADLGALEVGGAELDAGPDACVDVFLQRV